ncbi:FMN-dependent NADH-azoreductase [Hahella ganghwensis]|uniref:FMN-dependent NADH-azoreductase n=1 Tax=Hahella ganghwensis TaxID=286420 RepID=UPI00036C5D5D|nr:NAD(P)H-dependent oxidoreductase [Hahella ganghwensis]
MTCLLHLDASGRPGRSGTHAHGSLTRRLTHHFVSRWNELSENNNELCENSRDLSEHHRTIYRDVGAHPPQPVNGEWIQAAFSSADSIEPWMEMTLSESDQLIDEVSQSDIIVLEIPMYNFSVPSAFKAWIDNIVRIGRTFDFDPNQTDHPYTPLLSDRPRKVVLLSSRGGYGMNPGGEFAYMNHLEPSVKTALEFIGLTDMECIAVEYQEVGGDALINSLAKAEKQIDQLVERLLREIKPDFVQKAG